jgi:hypothetical protein
MPALHLRPAMIGMASLAVLTGACARPFYVGTDGVRVGDQSQTAPARDSTSDTRVTRKRVAGMEAPSTLIATDGTRCVVTAERFASIQSGERVWCMWR